MGMEAIQSSDHNADKKTYHGDLVVGGQFHNHNRDDNMLYFGTDIKGNNIIQFHYYYIGDEKG
jgi:hypothetical protein